MIKVQLTEKAENIVNQIMSADAVDVSYGPVKVRVYTDNINFDDEGVIMNTSENDDAGVPFISNDSINKAEMFPYSTPRIPSLPLFTISGRTV